MKRKKTIAIFSGTYVGFSGESLQPAERSSNNGTGSVVNRMVVMLRAAGHKVIVIGPEFGFEDPVSLLGVGWPNFRLFKEHPNFTPNHPLVWAAIRTFEQKHGRIQYVYRHTEDRMGEFATLLGVHVSASCTVFPEVLLNRGHLYGELMATLRQRSLTGSPEDILRAWFWNQHSGSSQILYPGALRDVYLACGFDEKKLRPWLQGYDPAVYYPELPLRPYRTANQEMVFVGRMDEDKRPEDALLLSIRHKVMIGDGELAEPLRARFSSPEVEFLSFSGIGETMVAEKMREADIMVVPSWSETYGLAMYQGLGSGLVILARDIPAMRQIVTPDIGVLIPIGEDLEFGVQPALELLHKPGTRQKCLRAAEHLTWDESYRQFEAGLVPR